ncbi:hypothetical protein GJAV_G00168120 [Gymnothorax javanicus]|nr:hypothetical protein GJAV_G00168120 [Gymnothorax javanicus]
MSDRQENEPRADTADLRLVLIGGMNSGKSSAGNTILGKRAFAIDNLAKRCTIQQVMVAGKKLTVVDTPGWDFYLASIPRNIKKETERAVSLCHPGPDGFLLTIPVGSDIMWSGLEKHMGLLGTQVWQYTIVLFTCGDRLAGSTIEQYIFSKGEALQRLLKNCKNRYHVFDNLDIKDKSQVHNLLEKIEKMRSENVRCYMPVICSLVEPDIKPDQEQKQTHPDKEKWKQNSRELGGENNSTNRDQGENWILTERNRTQNTSRQPEAPGNTGAPESTPAPALNRSGASLGDTLCTADIGGLQGRGDEESRGQIGRAEREKGDAGEKGVLLNSSQLPGAPESHGQNPLQLGVMVVQLDKAAESLFQMHEQQVRGEAERHRVTEQMFAALKAQSAAVSQKFTTALSRRDQERDMLLAEMERLRESTEEKDRQMESLRESCVEKEAEIERLRESCVEKEAEIERLKQEVVKVKRGYVQTVDELEKNKRVLQQLKTLVGQW